jgi:sulfide:quinone oxidoreductase
MTMSEESQMPQDPHIDRRKLLMLGAAGLIPSFPAFAASAEPKVRTAARIVIAGAGAAGLAAANRLAQRLEGATITLVDKRKEHYYQPGFTLVAAGLKQPGYSISATKDYLPFGVSLVEEAVREFDPVGNKVVTESGRAVPYDYLIVATGLELAYSAIEGMDTATASAASISAPRARPRPIARCRASPTRVASASSAARPPR